jgi:hypothetical protein
VSDRLLMMITMGVFAIDSWSYRDMAFLSPSVSLILFGFLLLILWGPVPLFVPLIGPTIDYVSTTDLCIFR